jgi:hypothetical protein
MLPLSGSNTDSSFIIEGQDPKMTGAYPDEEIRDITPDYFRVLETPLLKGRFFTEADTADLLVGYQGAVGTEKEYTSYDTGYGYGPGWYGGGWGGPVAAGILGGLALGALAGSAYAYGPAYYGRCYWQSQPAYDAWGNFAGYQPIQVCY